EGQTEEAFVNQVLAGHLISAGYSQVTARLLGGARGRVSRGGIRPWESVQSSIVRHLKEDPGRIVTTMVDFYALPGGWPGRAMATGPAPASKASLVESAVSSEIVRELGAYDARRFVPFVVMHEFEALLFSDCDRLARALDRPDLAVRFREIRGAFPNPEGINDSPETAPSKRLTRLFPRYDKVLFGRMVAAAIGLNGIRQECPHFGEWLTTIELAAGLVSK
ncbi:MAG: DUF4276 family protein, partial [Dehalococcoidia bacterium]|nr:DUF4276 family protein [Dehalococcoidia bacterium]